MDKKNFILTCTIIAMIGLLGVSLSNLGMAATLTISILCIALLLFSIVATDPILGRYFNSEQREDGSIGLRQEY